MTTESAKRKYCWPVFGDELHARKLCRSTSAPRRSLHFARFNAFRIRRTSRHDKSSLMIPLTGGGEGWMRGRWWLKVTDVSRITTRGWNASSRISIVMQRGGSAWERGFVKGTGDVFINDTRERSATFGAAIIHQEFDVDGRWERERERARDVHNLQLH